MQKISLLFLCFAFIFPVMTYAQEDCPAVDTSQWQIYGQQVAILLPTTDWGLTFRTDAKTSILREPVENALHAILPAADETPLTAFTADPLFYMEVNAYAISGADLILQQKAAANIQLDTLILPDMEVPVTVSQLDKSKFVLPTALEARTYILEGSEFTYTISLILPAGNFEGQCGVIKAIISSFYAPQMAHAGKEWQVITTPNMQVEVPAGWIDIIDLMQHEELKDEMIASNPQLAEVMEFFFSSAAQDVMQIYMVDPVTQATIAAAFVETNDGPPSPEFLVGILTNQYENLGFVINESSVVLMPAGEAAHLVISTEVNDAGRIHEVKQAVYMWATRAGFFTLSVGMQNAADFASSQSLIEHIAESFTIVQ